MTDALVIGAFLMSFVAMVISFVSADRVRKKTKRREQDEAQEEIPNWGQDLIEDSLIQRGMFDLLQENVNYLMERPRRTYSGEKVVPFRRKCDMH